ncbi:MAG: ParB/RepB/Spo0J family partition protein [Deltaproteobacteria bacterium]|nr:ParB/RepB/Spo0J family partition protein [Deltaproteobacteria bacterium]
MTVQKIDLTLIDDNPYQPRTHYPRNRIDELAYSIAEHGLIHTPLARSVNGRFQIAEGHLRKRAFLKLCKKTPKTYSEMPLDVQEITDERMALLALEENMRRVDLQPMEVARAVETYLTNFKTFTEVALAKKLNVTQGHISNMRRVVRLPAKVLEAVDEGRINFTMARELCVLQGLSAGTYERYSSKESRYVKHTKDEEYLMWEVVKSIVKVGTERQFSQEPATVDGMKRAIAAIAKDNFKALERGNLFAGWGQEEVLFDTREAGCLKCESMIRTWPQKSTVAHYCTKPKCWGKKQEAFKKEAATETKKRMQTDVVKKVVAAEAQRELQKTVTGKDPGVLSLQEESALIPLGDTAETISQEIPSPSVKEVEAAAEQQIIDREAEKEAEQTKKRQEQLKGRKDWPCLSCVEIGRCRGSGVRAGDKEAGEAEYVCDDYTTKKDQPKLKEKATLNVPKGLQEKIKVAAGTRAEILDLRELRYGFGDLKQGFALLDRVFKEIDDPAECLERCTNGFHYAFDSSPLPSFGTRKLTDTYHVCSNTKCLAQKKAAFTRAKNAKRNALKKAEAAAIKKAVSETTGLDSGRMRVILLAQIHGRHVQSYMYGTEKSVATWLWHKFSAGTPQNEQKDEKLFQIIEKLDDQALAQLVVELMFYFLKDSPDSEHYQARTKEPLSWLGIKIEA